MAQKLIFLVVAALLIFTSCSSDRIAVASKQQVSVFEREEDAAYGSSLSKYSIKPVATLQEGEEVLVLNDTFGKDYWACKVKLKNNTSGWVLCNELNFQGGS